MRTEQENVLKKLNYGQFQDCISKNMKINIIIDAVDDAKEQIA